jgi:hypothetical protein
MPGKQAFGTVCKPEFAHKFLFCSNSARALVVTHTTGRTWAYNPGTFTLYCYGFTGCGTGSAKGTYAWLDNIFVKFAKRNTFFLIKTAFETYYAFFHLIKCFQAFT